MKSERRFVVPIQYALKLKVQAVEVDGVLCQESSPKRVIGIVQADGEFVDFWGRLHIYDFTIKGIGIALIFLFL